MSKVNAICLAHDAVLVMMMKSVITKYISRHAAQWTTLSAF